MMHSDFYGNWLCGPGGFFSGFHFGGILPLIVFGIVLYMVFKAISHLLSGPSTQATSAGCASSSLSILEERYASGDIGQEEFLQKKRDLKS